MIVSILANIVSTVLSAALSLLLTPYIIKHVGKELYSFYPIANNIISYIWVITLALNSMASRFITIEIVRKNTLKAHQYFSSVFIANIIMSGLLAIPMTLLIVYSNSIFNIPQGAVQSVQILFIFLFVSTLVNLIFSVYEVTTFTKERMDLRGYKDIGRALLRGGLLLFLFCFLAPKIEYIGLAVFVASIYNAFFAFVISKKLIPEYKISLSNYSVQAIKELISSGVWNSVNNIGGLLSMSLIIVLANILIDEKASGNVAISSTIPHFLSSVNYAVVGVLIPRIANQYAKSDSIALKNTVQRTQEVLGIICTIPIVLLLCYGKDFFGLWVPNEDANRLQLLSIIITMPTLISSKMWTIHSLNVTNNTIRNPAVLHIVLGLISLFLTIVLLNTVSRSEFVVAAVPSAIISCFYLFYIPTYTATKMNYPVFTFYPNIIKSVICSILLIVLIWGARTLFSIKISSWADLIIIGFFSEIVGALLYFNIVLSQDSRKFVLNFVTSFLLKQKKI